MQDKRCTEQAAELDRYGYSVLEYKRTRGRDPRAARMKTPPTEIRILNDLLARIVNDRGEAANPKESRAVPSTQLSTSNN